MGSVLSAAYAAICSFVIAQLDKREARRLMAIYPGLRDMPADERDSHLRRLIDEKKECDKNSFPLEDGWGLRESDGMRREDRCNYMPPSTRGGRRTSYSKH